MRRYRRFHTLWFSGAIVLGLLAACRAAPAPETPAPSATVSPTLRPSLTPTADLPTSIPVAPTNTPFPPTATASPTPTPTPTPTPFDWTQFEPGFLSGIPVDCPTPKSLMLHIAFGAERMEELAVAIEAHNLTTITYRDIIEGLLRGECPAKDTIVVSLDDLGTSWLLPGFADMVQVFLDHDLKMVVGVVVKEPQASFVWEYLQEIHAAGIEVASHSVNHFNLNEIDHEVMVQEVRGSFSVICEHLGTCPVSFILPFGAYSQQVILTSEEFTFVVGIGGGYFFGGELPFYIGRQGPYVYDQQVTIQRLAQVYDVNFQAPTQSQTTPHPIRTLHPID